MKKIILFLAILSVSFFSSCSNDEDSNDTTPTPEDAFSAKINGVQKNFTVTNVDVIEYEGYTDVEITAHISGDPTNIFELNLTRDSGEVFFVQYSEVGNYYQPSPMENFTVSIGENTTNKLKGTFSGTMLETSDTSNVLTVTNGAFDIYY
jgi:hypothetical protein